MRGLDQAAKYMAQARPDLWDENGAYRDLRIWQGYVDEVPEKDLPALCGSGGFILRKTNFDGDTEYELSMSVISMYGDGTDDEPFDWLDKNPLFK